MKSFKAFASKAWDLRNHYEKDNVPHSKLKISVTSQIVAKIFEEGDLPSQLVIDYEFSDADLLFDVSNSVLTDLGLKEYKPIIHDEFRIRKSVSSVLFEKH